MLGLIGYPLGHSWSKEIHELFINHEYTLFSLDENQFNDFMNKKEFDGINVTIPYKEKVISFLDEIDDDAKRIKAVNCIINHHGELKGYNTDILGFKWMLRNHQIDLNNKKIAILGTGGASKAVRIACEDLKGKVLMVSRNPKNDEISYDDLKNEKIDILINTTPIGMYPKVNESIIDLSNFSLECCIDIVANPLRTKLQYQSKLLNIPYISGIEMLVAQAFYADELFLNKKLDEKIIDNVLHKVINNHRNIVLIGMPTSGKTTIAKALSQKLNIPYLDLDEKLEEEKGISIKKWFELEGEDSFRKKENELIKEISLKTPQIISTGGGVIKNQENMYYLSMNGIIVWLDRDLDYLYGSDDRPLSLNKDEINKLYLERKELYLRYCDIRIENNESIEELINKLEAKL